MKIADNSGVWLTNTAQFALHDSESNTRFEPQEPTKATLTQFVKDQPTIIRCADPTTDISDKQQAKLDEQIAQDEADRQAREKQAEQTRLASDAAGGADPAPAPVADTAKK